MSQIIKSKRRKKVEIICKNCKNPFKTHISNIERGKGIFCSIDCHYNSIDPNINKELFSLIKTEPEAYWLGFITGDGHLDKWHSVMIGLQIKDYNHLVKFKSFLNTDKEIKLTTQNGYRLSVPSKELTLNIKNLGVKNNKTFTVKPCTQVPDYLLRHYWRGLVDADGWIYKDQQNRWNLGFCGNKYMVEGFRNYIENIIGKKMKIRSKQNIFSVNYCTRDSQKIVNFIYKDCNIYLDRKMKIAREIMNWKESKRGTKLIKIPNNTITNTYNQLGNWELVANDLGVGRRTLIRIRKRQELM